MFKIKIKKLASKIICGALIGLVLSLTQASAVYAIDPTPPVPPPSAACPLDPATGKVVIVGTPPQQCTIEKAKECPAGYTKGESADKTQATCTKNEVDGADPEVSKDLLNTVAMLVGIQGFLNKLIWPVLTLIGGLLENDLLFGGAMEERLRDIWIPMRNLVNILFIIVLVGIALYNVLGLGDDSSEYSIKSALPKIIVGIIAINFSFLAIKVFLDLVNVMTTSIFSLPGSINPQLEQVIDPTKDAKIVKSLCANLAGLSPDKLTKMSDSTWEQTMKTQIRQNAARNLDITIAFGDSIETIEQKVEKAGKKIEFDEQVKSQENGKLCEKDKLSPNGELFLKRYNSRNAAFALALNMGHIVFYNEANLFSGLEPNNIEKLLINSIFSMLLYLVYVASFLALFAVLLGRLLIMWISVAVSPLLLLTFAAPTLKDKLGGFSKLSEQFIKNAIAPILIALSMTVGWIMLRAVQGLSPGSSDPFNGSIFSMDPTGGVPVVGLSTLQDLVVACGVVGVVWLGVFSAAEDTLAEGATNWMKDKLLDAGKWIGKLPFKHAPIVPIALPGHEHGHYTVSQVGRALETIMTPDDTKLASLMKGETISKPQDLQKVKTKAELIDTIGKMPKSDLMSEEFRKELARNPHTRKLIEDRDGLLKSSNHDEQEIGKHLNELLKGKDLKKADLERIADKLRLHARPAGGPATGPTPQGPKATNFEDSDIQPRKTGNTIEKPEDTQARREQVKSTVSDIATQVQLKDTGKITAGIKNLKTNGITLEKFKKIFSTQYNDIVTLFGGGAKGEKAIADAFKSTGTATTSGPTPPQAPPTPPSGNPQQAGGQPPEAGSEPPATR